MVVLALVAVPLGALAVARSQPAPAGAVSAYAVVARGLGLANVGGRHLRPVGCHWTQGHTRISCLVAGGGSCDFKADGAGTCSGSSGANSDWQIVILVGSDHRP